MAYGFNDPSPRDDADPVESAGGVTQFDFEGLADRLDGIIQPNATDKELAFALARIIRWIVDVDSDAIPPDKRAMIVGRRAYILAWAAVPGAVHGMSLRALAVFLNTRPERLAEISTRLPIELNFRGARQTRPKVKAA